MKCKKIVYRTGDPQPFDRKVLYGIILSEAEEFLIFQTAAKEYRISKGLILTLEDTNRDFIVGEKVKDGDIRKF